MNLINLILICVLLLAVIIYLTYLLLRPQQTNTKEKMTVRVSLDDLKSYVIEEINKLTGSNLYDLALDEDDFIRLQNQRSELKSAIKRCASGNLYDKIYVKSIISDILMKGYEFDDTTINYVIPFDDPEQLTAIDKFDIVLYVLKQQYKYQALNYMIKAFGLDQLRNLIEDGQSHAYIVTSDDIERIYKRVMAKYSLSLHDKLEIVTQRIYQQTYGLGVIDEIRDMEIEGVSGGVSGVPPTLVTLDDEEEFLKNMRYSKPQSFDSIWVMTGGITYYLSFLSFGTHHELKRICQTIYKHNMPGMLSERQPYIVNDLADGSRINVMRPPYSSSWAFFNRKFNTMFTTYKQYLNSKGEIIPNWECVAELLKFMMRGSQTTVITANQGVGKTTLIMTMIGDIYPWLKIRIFEMAFELNAQRLYPERNILNVRPVGEVTTQMAMDNLKKTDGDILIVGEAATDEEVIAAIQAKQVSKSTILSHHAQTFDDLVFNLRNSTLKAGLFRDEIVAQQEVVNFIDFNVHLAMDHRGFRYVERITECIPLSHREPYSDDINQATLQFFERITDRRTYEARDILVFENGQYVTKNRISDQRRMKMLRNMTPEDRDAFQAFEEAHWVVAT